MRPCSACSSGRSPRVPSSRCPEASPLLPALRAQREAVFQRDFLEDLRFWIEADRRTALRTLQFVEAVLRDPFQGIGKPEPLKHVFAGAWSRRLTQEHRIVYLVGKDRIDFLQAPYHY